MGHCIIPSKWALTKLQQQLKLTRNGGSLPYPSAKPNFNEAPSSQHLLQNLIRSGAALSGRPPLSTDRSIHQLNLFLRFVVNISTNLGNDEEFDKDGVWVDEYGLEMQYDDKYDKDEYGLDMENDDAPALDILGRKIIMDYTNIFTNMTYFESRDALLSWVRCKGNEHNTVIVVNRSDYGCGNKKARIFLACKRGVS